MSQREERLEGALEIALGRLSQISRGRPVSRSTNRKMTASEAQWSATCGIEEVMRAVAGQEVRYTPCQTKIVLGPGNRDAASDVLRAMAWVARHTEGQTTERTIVEAFREAADFFHKAGHSVDAFAIERVIRFLERNEMEIIDATKAALHTGDYPYEPSEEVSFVPKPIGERIWPALPRVRPLSHPRHTEGPANE